MQRQLYMANLLEENPTVIAAESDVGLIYFNKNKKSEHSSKNKNNGVLI